MAKKKNLAYISSHDDLTENKKFKSSLRLFNQMLNVGQKEKYYIRLFEKYDDIVAKQK